jgi:DNA-binding NarL/FixJ family response regulator
VRIVAVVTDLMDRSRITAAIPTAAFARSPAEVTAADIVVVDLRVGAGGIGTVRAKLPNAHIVVFGPHVDDEAMTAARAAGADVALPRSRFFRDIATAVAPPTAQ